MPRRIVLLLLASSAFACGSRAVGEVSEPTSSVVTEDIAKAIEGAVEQYRQAYEVRSPEALSALYRQDLDLKLVFQGRLHEGWTQVETFLAARLAGASKVRMVVSDLRVQELGAMAALATARLESTIGDDASTVTEKGVLTLVFQKTSGSWLIVAEHFSYPTGPS